MVTKDDPQVAQDEPRVTQRDPWLTQNDPRLTQDDPRLTLRLHMVTPGWLGLSLGDLFFQGSLLQLLSTLYLLLCGWAY